MAGGNVKVALAQQQVSICPDEEVYAADVARFMRQAARDGCQLIAFPEGCGSMLTSQFLPKPLVAVLAAAHGEPPHGPVGAVVSPEPAAPSLLGRIGGVLQTAGKAALGGAIDKLSSLGDLTATFVNTVREHSPALLASYTRVFSGAAREHSMYVVGGSLYWVGPTGSILNSAFVFGPDGKLLGRQDKIHLYIEDTHICSPGSAVQVFETDFGKIGVPICYEGMFPETSRMMAHLGAEALINVSACPGELCYRKIRAGIWSRVQDNQVYGAHVTLIGRNDLSKQYTADYTGRSTLLAPIDLTPDFSGVLAEADNGDREGLVVGIWDFDALHALWETSDTRVRREFRPDLLAAPK